MQLSPWVGQLLALGSVFRTGLKEELLPLLLGEKTIALKGGSMATFPSLSFPFLPGPEPF